MKREFSTPYLPQVFFEGVPDSGRAKMHQAPSADASFCGHLRCFAKKGSESWKLARWIGWWVGLLGQKKASEESSVELGSSEEWLKLEQ